MKRIFLIAVLVLGCKTHKKVDSTAVTTTASISQEAKNISSYNLRDSIWSVLGGKSFEYTESKTTETFAPPSSEAGNVQNIVLNGNWSIDSSASGYIAKNRQDTTEEVGYDNKTGILTHRVGDKTKTYNNVVALTGARPVSSRTTETCTIRIVDTTKTLFRSKQVNADSLAYTHNTAFTDSTYKDTHIEKNSRFQWGGLTSLVIWVMVVVSVLLVLYFNRDKIFSFFNKK